MVSPMTLIDFDYREVFLFSGRDCAFWKSLCILILTLQLPEAHTVN